MSVMRPHRRLQSIAAALALGAMLLRALLPAGFMPAAGEDAGLRMELCTANGLQSIAVDGADDPLSSQQRTHAAGCVFAAVAASGPPVVAIAEGPRVVASGPALPVVADVAPRSPPLRQSLPRGPPALA